MWYLTHLKKWIQNLNIESHENHSTFEKLDKLVQNIEIHILYGLL